VIPPPQPLHEFLVPPEAAGLRLDVFLAQKGLPYSRSQLGRRIEEGEVFLDGNPTKPGQRLRPGQRIRFTPPPPTPTSDLPEDLPLDILYEDRHLIVLCKPAGMVVHPAPGHERGTLVNALLHHCGPLPAPPARPGGRADAAPARDGDSDSDGDSDEEDDDALPRGELSIGGQRRPGIVHRLDQGTSGVIVCAKDEPTLVGLQAQFQVHSIARRYVALVEGVAPERGTFSTRFGRHPRDRKRFTGRGGSKKAVTHFQVLERLPGATLVEVQLETGRTHQIRVHFSEAGHPVLGDPLYGRASRHRLVHRVSQSLGHQALHARLLGFVHPVTGQRLSLQAPPPADFLQALETLRAALPARPAPLPWEIAPC
jgi:23S rRNA pseudouridine1911/1915/1917 synthase